VVFSFRKLLGARPAAVAPAPPPPDIGPDSRDDQPQPEHRPVVETRPVQPLVELYGPDERFDLSETGLLAWKGSPSYDRAVAFYRNYPAGSLQSDEARALLHHLVVMHRPERVLEIGTWHAGTTETLARALHETGRGEIETIDPFGAERCPPIIAALPPELRNIITFYPDDSAKHFDRVLSNNAYYDFVLVDGNHEFEFALFDVMCAARTMRPGGIIVMDNIEQVGPRLAAKAFLDRNPDWQDVAGVVRQIDMAAPFRPAAPSFPDTKFYVLKAPPHYVIRQDPRIFGPATVDRAEVDEIELDVAAPARGTLHMLVHLRTFGLLEPEELACRQAVVLDTGLPTADGRVRIPLRQPLFTGRAESGLTHRLEISLSFSGDHGLMLRSAPLPFPAKYIKATGL
jgi:predicted O-methyltransferase YrrM